MTTHTFEFTSAEVAVLRGVMAAKIKRTQGGSRFDIDYQIMDKLAAVSLVDYMRTGRESTAAPGVAPPPHVWRPRYGMSTTTSEEEE